MKPLNSIDATIDPLMPPEREIQWPSVVPAHILPIVMKNNIALAQKPLTLPPGPQIFRSLTGTTTGFQFSFNQVTLPASASNTISSYRIYRNTQNVFGKSLIATIQHDPTHIGAVTFTDTIMAASGLHYFYWVTSVDTAGQESLPQAAQSLAITGSIGSTPFSLVNAMTYTSTTTTITWSWSGLVINRSDGTNTAIPNGSQLVTGLTPSTTYFFYPYWDETSQSVQWVAGGTGTPAYAQLATSSALSQSQNLRNRIPLNTGGMQGSTPAGGTGGGSGDGGGGGGCFSGNVMLKIPHGYVAFEECPLDWFPIENNTGVHLARLIVHPSWHEEMIDMGNDRLVTLGHYVKWHPNQPFSAAVKVLEKYPTVDYMGTVYNLEIATENEESRHYILRNGLIAHNTNVKPR